MALDPRIVSNVQKMVDQKAPPSDIDGYLKQEGLTPEAFKSAVSEPADQPLYKAAGRGVVSFLPSAVKGGANILEAAFKPVETLTGLKNIGEGAIAKVPGGKSLLTAIGQNPQEIAKAEQSAEALGQDYANAYGSWPRAKETLATDPFRLLTDLSVGAGAAGKAASATKASKLGSALEKTSEVTNPVGAITKPTSYASKFFGEKPESLAAKKSVNATRDATLKQSLEAGYTIPRSSYNPSAATNVLESVGGKAAIGQDAAKSNQMVTDKLARKYLNLPEDTAFSQPLIDDLLESRAKPYKDAAALPAVQTTSTSGGMVKAGQTRDGAVILDELKKARDVSRANWKAINNGTSSNATETMQSAQAADDLAFKLENEIESLAKLNNKPELLNELKQSRKELAKVHTIEKAMNPATGEINAANIKQQYNKNVPLTGEAKVIADFSNSFGQLSREGSKVPNADVNQTKALAAYLASAGSGGAAGTMFGGPVGGAIGAVVSGAAPFVVPPAAKAAALSKYLQKMPTYEQNIIKKMMKQSPKANPLAAALYEMHNATNQEEQ